MFSHRLPADQSPNRLSEALARRRASGVSFIDLTESNPTRCGFRRDERALLDALAAAGSLRYDPHPQGLMVARAAVARYYLEAGVEVDPENLVLTTGTSEAYAQVFKLLADPGDEILVPTPGYPLLDVLSRLESIRIVPYALRRSEEGWSIDAERVRATASTRTKAIVVVSPNNPTGSFLKGVELEGLNGVCGDLGCALIVDEVFSEYARGPDPRRAACTAGNVDALTFTLNGLSKLAALPQMKLGWIAVSGPRDLLLRARERLAYVADAFLSVSAPVQHAAELILGSRTEVQAQIRGRLIEHEAVLDRGLSGIRGCRRLPCEGGWYAVVEIPEDPGDEKTVLRLLEEDGVLAHPGYFYDFTSAGFLVVSLLGRSEEFTRGVSRLSARLRIGSDP